MPQPPLSDDLKKQALEAYQRCGGNKSHAAKSLGIPRNTFCNRLSACNLDPSVAGLDKFIPDGQKLKGVSTLYSKDGEMVGQWVKTTGDQERQLEMLREAAEALMEDIPREKPVKAKPAVNKDLLSLYVLTDYHIGQMSWAGETGEDWDTDKSCQFLVDWFTAAVAAAPASQVGVLCQLGDFLHFDGLEPVTPRGKHVVDTDARYAKVVGCAIKAVRRIVQIMLTKHEKVHIIMAEGNHDMASSVWLRALFADKYEDEPRVTVDNSSLPYYVYEHGKTSLFFHHGHLKKMSEISGTFSAMFREVFGRTKFSYVHMGHMHHIDQKESGGMVIRQHRTMAVKDAHTARGGWVSDRSASVVTYHKQYGYSGEVSITPEMLK